jgi:hypothetical protein
MSVKLAPQEMKMLRAVSRRHQQQQGGRPEQELTLVDPARIKAMVQSRRQRKGRQHKGRPVSSSNWLPSLQANQQQEVQAGRLGRVVLPQYALIVVLGPCKNRAVHNRTQSRRAIRRTRKRTKQQRMSKRKVQRMRWTMRIAGQGL